MAEFRMICPAIRKSESASKVKPMALSEFSKPKAKEHKIRNHLRFYPKRQNEARLKEKRPHLAECHVPCIDGLAPLNLGPFIEGGYFCTKSEKTCNGNAACAARNYKYNDVLPNKIVG